MPYAMPSFEASGSRPVSADAKSLRPVTRLGASGRSHSPNTSHSATTRAACPALTASHAFGALGLGAKQLPPPVQLHVAKGRGISFKMFFFF